MSSNTESNVFDLSVVQYFKNISILQMLRIYFYVTHPFTGRHLHTFDKCPSASYKE